MQRLALLIVLAIAACANNGPGSEMASLTSVTPMVQSAGANSFSGDDASGTKVLGWSIYLFSNGPGAPCNSNDTKVVASLGIFTNMADDGTKKVAQLAGGDIVIVDMAPPMVQGTAAANMSAMGMSNIVGTVSISEFYVRTDGSIDHIYGSINAGGTDANGNGVSLTGTFMAPNCD